MAIPNTFIIGVQKAGTTSLHDWLARHADVFGPPELKDVNYFNAPDQKDDPVRRIEKDFSGALGQKIVLHTQVNYLLFPEALERIKSLVPDAKIIVLLRDPVNRALSAYNYFVKIGREKRSAKEALIYEPEVHFKCSKDICDLAYIEHGFYGKQLEEVYSLFPEKQILVITLEKLRSCQETVLISVLSFLGIDKNFPLSLRKKNITGSVRSKKLHLSLTRKSRIRSFMVKVFFSWWIPLQKRQLFRKKLIDLNTDPEKKVPLEDEEEIRAYLEKLYKKDQEKLAFMRKSDQKKESG